MPINQFAGALDCIFQNIAQQNVIYIDQYTIQMAWNHVTTAKIQFSYCLPLGFSPGGRL